MIRERSRAVGRGHHGEVGTRALQHREIRRIEDDGRLAVHRHDAGGAGVLGHSSVQGAGDDDLVLTEVGREKQVGADQGVRARANGIREAEAIIRTAQPLVGDHRVRCRRGSHAERGGGVLSHRGVMRVQRNHRDAVHAQDGPVSGILRDGRRRSQRTGDDDAVLVIVVGIGSVRE